MPRKTEKPAETDAVTAEGSREMHMLTPEELMTMENVPIETRRLLFEDGFRRYLAPFSVEPVSASRWTLVAVTVTEIQIVTRYYMTRAPAKAVSEAWEYYSKYCPDGADYRGFLDRVNQPAGRAALFEADLVRLE